MVNILHSLYPQKYINLCQNNYKLKLYQLWIDNKIYIQILLILNKYNNIII